ncbi:12627_t:CDS:2, partial [Gigaspora margarita]
ISGVYHIAVYEQLLTCRMQMQYSPVEWDVKMEIEFFRAIMKHRPVGIHRHFHMVNVHHDFNANSAVKCTIPELWERFGTYFNLSKLEDLDRDFDEEADEDSAFTEFSLPMDEYYHLIEEHRKAGSSRGASPSPAPSKSQKSRREQSPSLSHTASQESSPEPEDNKKTRRTRTLRKPDVAESAKMQASSKRGGARTRKTSDAAMSSGTGPKRGGV